jgi:hypothetical protein
MVQNNKFSKELFSFLEIDKIDKVLPKSNVARAPKSIWIAKLILYLNNLISAISNLIRDILPIPFHQKIKIFYTFILNRINLIEENNMQKIKKIQIDPIVKNRLQNKFIENNQGLDNLIGIKIKKYWKWYL